MIKATGIIRKFSSGSGFITVLKGIDINVADGEFVSIIGRSGAGKSTLIYQLGLLDTPTEGEIIIHGEDVSKLSDREKTEFRLMNMGYIFQDYAILPELTAQENVALPAIMQGKEKRKAYESAEEVLEKVGLGAHLGNLPGQLSGGEQQRVSVARAIVNKPKIIFADEPTANLDLVNAKQVLDLLIALNKDGQTVVMVTHEQEYAKLTAEPQAGLEQKVLRPDEHAPRPAVGLRDRRVHAK